MGRTSINVQTTWEIRTTTKRDCPLNADRVKDTQRTHHDNRDKTAEIVNQLSSGLMTLFRLSLVHHFQQRIRIHRTYPSD